MCENDSDTTTATIRVDVQSPVICPGEDNDDEDNDGDDDENENDHDDRVKLYDRKRRYEREDDQVDFQHMQCRGYPNFVWILYAYMNFCQVLVILTVLLNP